MTDFYNNDPFAADFDVGILGVGNLLLGDEGFGVHFIRYLEARYSFPRSVWLMDGGTSGIFLSSFFEGVKRAMVIDAVSLNEKPGSILRFNHRELKARSVQMSMSPHQVGVLEVLEISKLRDKAPGHVDFFGIVPMDISTGIGLSPILEKKLPTVASMVLEYLDLLGIAVKGR